MKFNTIDDLKAAGFEGFIPCSTTASRQYGNTPNSRSVYGCLYRGKYARVSLPRYGRIL